MFYVLGMPLSLNFWAILLMTIVSMGFGMLWYSPILFGKTWIKLMGLENKKEEMQKKAGLLYFLSFLNYFLMETILALFLANFIVIFYTKEGIDAIPFLKIAFTGIVMSFLIWLGFVVPSTFTAVLWGRKPFKLWIIDIGFLLVLMSISGAIFVVWR